MEKDKKPGGLPAAYEHSNELSVFEKSVPRELPDGSKVYITRSSIKPTMLGNGENIKKYRDKVAEAFKNLDQNS